MDWLKELNAAQGAIVGVGVALDDKARSCANLGMHDLATFFSHQATILFETAELVSTGTSGAVNEIYNSARDSSMSMLAAVLATCEAKDREED